MLNCLFKCLFDSNVSHNCLILLSGVKIRLQCCLLIACTVSYVLVVFGLSLHCSHLCLLGLCFSGFSLLFWGGNWLSLLPFAAKLCYVHLWATTNFYSSKDTYDEYNDKAYAYDAECVEFVCAWMKNGKGVFIDEHFSNCIH